jgi:hypothetical protein
MNEIKLPIIVYDKHWHEVLVYLSVEDAEAYLDPCNAKNNEYQIYDANGTPLRIKYITQKESFLLGLGKAELEKVILDKSDDVNRVEELREVLSNFITRYGTPIDELNLFSLDELIREAAKLPKLWRARS